jgi:hypothetical protein
MTMNERDTVFGRDPESAELVTVLEPAVEELEDKIAPAFPGVNLNHNETLVLDVEEAGNGMVLEPAIEELEAIVAPGISENHNETLLQDNA